MTTLITNITYNLNIEDFDIILGDFVQDNIYHPSYSWYYKDPATGVDMTKFFLKKLVTLMK